MHTVQRRRKDNSFYSPIGKETLGVSLVTHGLRKLSKATMRDSRPKPGLSITTGSSGSEAG